MDGILFIALNCSTAKVVVCINKFDIIMKPDKNIDNMYIVRNSGTFLIVDVNKIIGKCTQYDDNGVLTIFKIPLSYEMCT